MMGRPFPPDNLTDEEKEAWYEREDKRIAQEAERERRFEAKDIEDALRSYVKLPLAMSTAKCPKCLYGEFDQHQGLETSYVERAWINKGWNGHPSGFWSAPATELLQRDCPRCKYSFYERTGDDLGITVRGKPVVAPEEVQ